LPSSKSLQKLTKSNQPIVLPIYDGKKGHPVVLSNDFCKKLTSLNPTHKQSRLDVQIGLIPKNQVFLEVVDDASVTKNLNNPMEWEYFLKNS